MKYYYIATEDWVRLVNEWHLRNLICLYSHGEQFNGIGNTYNFYRIYKKFKQNPYLPSTSKLKFSNTPPF